MATVEGRRSDECEGGGFVKTLKFWRWAGDKYTVNTQYPRPHGSEDITALTFGAPSFSYEPFVITASTSGSVKIWQVRQAKKSENGEYSLCRVVVSPMMIKNITFITPL
jgi:NET1-associated nuclear protein 1 (U3 small nucleolar RNA-associated protein 17)